ncbi:putative DD41D transposase [Trichonephila clavipes]|nr:putative DD41D transposase [Trichonephila clavipes]
MSHTARVTIDLLKDTFGDRLISRFGPVNWPPRSCDLTPLDYFLWDYVKSLVYADKPQTLDHLEDNIRRVIADIRPQMLEKVIENWTSRLDYIRASRGSHMPEIIFKIGKNRLRIFTLRLTGGAHRYHCSRRKQKPTSDVNKALTGGAQRSSGDQSRGFSTADSHWLGTRACAVLAISLRCQSMFRNFAARLEILTLKLGEWGATSVVLLVTQLKFQITRSMSVEFVTLVS